MSSGRTSGQAGTGARLLSDPGEWVMVPETLGGGTDGEMRTVFR